MRLTDSQTEILEAATVVMARDGMEGINMRSVASEAGVSLGLLGYHFTGKQTMVVATFQLVADRLIDHRLAVVTAAIDPRERLATFFRSPFDPALLGGSCPALMLTLWASARTDDDLAAVAQWLADSETEELTGLIEQPRPGLVAAVLAMQRGLIVDWVNTASRERLDAGIEQCSAIAETNALARSAAPRAGKATLGAAERQI